MLQTYGASGMLYVSGIGSSGSKADFLAVFDYRFVATLGVGHNILVDLDGTLLKQENYRGTAKLEITLFLSPTDLRGKEMVDNFSNQQSAYFHHYEFTKFPAAQDTVFPGIFLVDRKVVVGDGIDCM